MAPKNVLRHQKKCYDTKKCAAAQKKRVLWHQKICYGNKKFALAKKCQIITLFFFPEYNLQCKKTEIQNTVLIHF